MEVQAAEDPTDEPELEVLDDNAVKLDTSNVPIMLSVSQVHEFAISFSLCSIKSLPRSLSMGLHDVNMHMTLAEASCVVSV